MVSIKLGSAQGAGDLLTLGFDYGATNNNGNVLSQMIARPSFSATQTYTYDAYNRIQKVEEGSNHRDFQYKEPGNMYVPSSQGTGWAPGSFTPVSPTWFDEKNRLVNPLLGIQYDEAGNLTAIGGFTFAYDAENRLVSSTLNSVTTTYAYDGEGRRVKKGSVVMVYDAFGRLAAEYGGTADPVGTEYLTADHLGSTRLVTSAAGAEQRCLDYLPFGEQMTQGMGTRGACYASATEPRVKFTGKERDQETGLDYFGARYFSGVMGRFASPDPLLNGGRPWEPQSWNRYAYVLNNPLKYVDPKGLYEWAANCASGDKQCEENRQKFRDALATVRTAAGQLKEGSKERKKLDAILAKFGAEGEKNRVKIAFGAAGGYPAEQSTGFFSRTNTITFDMNMIGTMLNRNAQVNSDYKPSIGFAEIVTHEGSHMLDKFFFGNPVNREGSYRTEFNAFESQSYVPMSLNQYSHYGLWNPSWAEADREALRQKAVQKITEDHVNEMWGPKKP